MHGVRSGHVRDNSATPEVPKGESTPSHGSETPGNAMSCRSCFHRITARKPISEDFLLTASRTTCSWPEYCESGQTSYSGSAPWTPQLKPLRSNQAHAARHKNRAVGSPPPTPDARYSFLPRYSRIEAWYAVAPIGIFPRNIHLPYELRTIALGDLRDLRPRAPRRRRRVEFHVSVA